MRLLNILLITLTTVTGCQKKDTRPVKVITDTIATAKPMTPAITYLALGDSYTIGEAVSQAESYPYQLAASLNTAGLNVQKPDVIAVTGWTTDNLINAIAQSGFKNNQYDFVTLLIGVNDQYQRLSKDNYRIKFAQVLQTAIKFAHGDASKVFVISIPDWGVTPFAGGQDAVIGPDIDAFNAINKEETAKALVPNYIDITPESRDAANDRTLIAGDGLHPSGKMYAEWVKLLAPVVKASLAKN
ncbi:MAG TPA: GDSL-type esterase/lipase family protein [Mucilaginibacter sp.]